MGQGMISAAAHWLRQSLRTDLVAAAAGTLWATAQAQSAGGTAVAEPVLPQAYRRSTPV